MSVLYCALVLCDNCLSVLYCSASKISRATTPGICSKESFVYNKVGWELSKLCSSQHRSIWLGLLARYGEESTLFCQGLILNGEPGLVIRRDYQINIQTTPLPNPRRYFCVVLGIRVLPSIMQFMFDDLSHENAGLLKSQLLLWQWLASFYPLSGCPSSSIAVTVTLATQVLCQCIYLKYFMV